MRPSGQPAGAGAGGARPRVARQAGQWIPEVGAAGRNGSGGAVGGNGARTAGAEPMQISVQPGIGTDGSGASTGTSAVGLSAAWRDQVDQRQVRHGAIGGQAVDIDRQPGQRPSDSRGARRRVVVLARTGDRGKSTEHTGSRRPNPAFYRQASVVVAQGSHDLRRVARDPTVRVAGCGNLRSNRFCGSATVVIAVGGVPAQVPGKGHWPHRAGVRDAIADAALDDDLVAWQGAVSVGP